MDVNGDGKVQAAELPARNRKNLLKNFDHNKDNAIDRVELTDLLETVRTQGLRALQ